MFCLHQRLLTIPNTVINRPGAIDEYNREFDILLSLRAPSGDFGQTVANLERYFKREMLDRFLEQNCPWILVDAETEAAEAVAAAEAAGDDPVSPEEVAAAADAACAELVEELPAEDQALFLETADLDLLRYDDGALRFSCTTTLRERCRVHDEQSARWEAERAGEEQLALEALLQRAQAREELQQRAQARSSRRSGRS